VRSISQYHGKTVAQLSDRSAEMDHGKPVNVITTK